MTVKVSYEAALKNICHKNPKQRQRKPQSSHRYCQAQGAVSMINLNFPSFRFLETSKLDLTRLKRRSFLPTERASKHMTRTHAIRTHAPLNTPQNTATRVPDSADSVHPL